jgi:hypothetical protein
MDRVTPSQIGVIALMVVFVISAILLIDSRGLWLPWVVALRDRFFVWHFPTLDELADRRAAYVEQRQKEKRRADTAYQVPPDTDAEYTISTDLTSTSIAVADTAALVRHLAIIKKVNGDYAMSGNRIVAAVEMGRNEVLAIVRDARGVTPEPLEAYDPAKHIKVGGDRWITR